MKIPALVLSLFSAIALAVCALAAPAWADSTPAAAWPARPIRLIVPYPAGGGADAWGRIVARALSEALGQPVVVDNIPGAGGNNGTAEAAKAAPDGYTLLLGSVGPLAVHPSTYNSLPFNAEHDFAPIALIESSPLLLVTHPSMQLSTVQQIKSLADAEPGRLKYASNGNGSPEQVAGELFKKKANIDVLHVPYNGAGPARKDLAAGQVSMMFDPCKGSLPAVRDGKLIAVAVASPRRLAQLPAVPTFAEVGVSNLDLRIWTGLLAPAGTSPRIVKVVNSAVRKIVQSPQMVKDIDQEGGETYTMSSTQFAAFLKNERRRWKQLVDASGVAKVDRPI